MSTYAVSIEDVRAAALRIAPFAHRTPVATCATLDRLAGRRLFFKCEHLQKTGAFKFRGACNALQQLSDADAARGVVTHSSGNHAQALALAARLRGIPAHIVMPSNAAAVKRRAVEEYGGRVVVCEPTLSAREATAAAVLAETGGTFIAPYDDARVIAGQGTTAVELIEQVDDLDAIVAPIGGGGLVSGICIAAGDHPRIRVFAAEPAGADDAARSMAVGRRLPQVAPHTVADGLLTGLGELTWPIVRDRVEAVVTVSEAAILTALRLCWERAKLLIEPSAAVAFAAVCTPAFRALPGLTRVGVVLSGGNVAVGLGASWGPGVLGS
ncbi:pyridoxal-phosphate dependent enzyme [Candidatus Binatia bacterium]|nr:pyridoxal-phosphate dependent enzyme [Candidatus Binatia bacterium]